MDASSLPDIAQLLESNIGPTTRAATCTAIAACSSGAQAAPLRHLLGTSTSGETIICCLIALCKDQSCVRLALSALVNISEDENAAAVMIRNGAVENAARSLLEEKERGMYSLHAGLLANLTRFGKGVDELVGKGMGERKEVRAVGVLMRLMGRVGGLPNLFWVANICTKEEGRGIVMEGEGKGLMEMLKVGGGNGEEVRFAVASTLRNCVLGEEWHEGMVERMGVVEFLLGRFAKEGGEAIEEIRVVLAEALLLLCKSRVGRGGLRVKGAFEVLDEWKEKELNQQVLVALESVLDRIVAAEHGEELEEDSLNGISVVETGPSAAEM